MNKNNLNFLVFIFLLFSSNILLAQELDLSEFELKAHYELSSNGIDLTGNFDTIELDNPIFALGGILSRGCYVGGANFGDSCLIETPEIDALNDPSFAIQLDFRIPNFGPTKPIVIAGKGWRFLGIESKSNGSLTLRTNNSTKDDIDGIFLNQDEWYNITLLHNTIDSNTFVYLNQELIFTKKSFLNHPESDTEISNSNFSVGRAFFGYWKNLKVFSKDITSSTSKIDKKSDLLYIFPNPVRSNLNVELLSIDNTIYTISDVNGRLIERSILIGNSINTQNLPPGIYLLSVYEENSTPKRVKFIKY